MKCTYDWILFDADETLFHFDDTRGLKRTFEDYGVEFTDQDYLDYQQVNKPLWVEYQNGAITASELYAARFKTWGDKLSVHPLEINNNFMRAMGEVTTPLEGAFDLIHALKDRYKLAIISNGFTELQKIRLEKTGLAPHFEHVVISEEVGIAKPDPRIFDHALEKMGQPERHKVLMVGDNPEADIRGGLNAGLHTCWLNRHGHPTPEDLSPHYEIGALRELGALLMTTPARSTGLPPSKGANPII